MLFNAKSSPHGKNKRQNRRAAHMERQRAPPKGREAENLWKADFVGTEESAAAKTWFTAVPEKAAAMESV